MKELDAMKERYRTMSALELVRIRHAFMDDRKYSRHPEFCDGRIAAIDAELKRRVAEGSTECSVR